MVHERDARMIRHHPQHGGTYPAHAEGQTEKQAGDRAGALMTLIQHEL